MAGTESNTGNDMEQIYNAMGEAFSEAIQKSADELSSSYLDAVVESAESDHPLNSSDEVRQAVENQRSRRKRIDYLDSKIGNLDKTLNWLISKIEHKSEGILEEEKIYDRVYELSEGPEEQIKDLEKRRARLNKILQGRGLDRLQFSVKRAAKEAVLADVEARAPEFWGTESAPQPKPEPKPGGLVKGPEPKKTHDSKGRPIRTNPGKLTDEEMGFVLKLANTGVQTELVRVDETKHPHVVIQDKTSGDYRIFSTRNPELCLSNLQDAAKILIEQGGANPEANTSLRPEKKATFVVQVDTASIVEDRFEGKGQDRKLVDDRPDRLTFGVFDGMGGMEGDPGLAAEIAARAVGEQLTYNYYDSKEEALKAMQRAFYAARDAVLKNKEGGSTTATVAQIAVINGHLAIVYGYAGDSRLYVRNNRGEIQQVTKDQGYLNQVDNGFFDDPMIITRKNDAFGIYYLKGDERIMLCTDGITGDTKEQIIPEGQFKAALDPLRTPAEAVARLVEISRKPDDKTVIVVDVNSGQNPVLGIKEPQLNEPTLREYASVTHPRGGKHASRK